MIKNTIPASNVMLKNLKEIVVFLRDFLRASMKVDSILECVFEATIEISFRVSGRRDNSFVHLIYPMYVHVRDGERGAQ